MGDSPWSNQVINLIILTEQATGFSGLFGYSPTVAQGNLDFSVAANSGTDPDGDAYQPGVVTYDGTTSYVQLNNGAINIFYTGMFEAASLQATASAIVQLASGLQNVSDIGASIACLSAAANSGSSGITLNAADVTTTAGLTVGGSTTVNINLTVDGSLTVNTGASISGGLTVDTINGSANTGSGNNGGVTSGPSGTVTSFPAAGPNHTHAEIHQHPI